MSLGFAISSFVPSIVSKGIFAPRRIDKASKASNPIVSIGNVGVADAQIVKAGEGVVEIAKEGKGSIAKGIVAFDKAIGEASKSSSIFKGISDIGKIAIDNINPMITGVSLLTITTADDKKREGIEQFFALGGMFGAEGAYKAITGMSKTKRVNGKTVVEPVDGLYKKNPFLKAQVSAFKDACAAHKALKHAPAIIKGIGFAVFASIPGFYCGHKIGKAVANAALGEKKDKKTENKEAA